MLTFNAFGGADKVPTGTYIDHSPNSSKYDTSDILKFSWDHTLQSEDSFYIDETIPMCLTDKKSNKKYGWLLESKAIIPSVYEDFKKNINLYMEKLDLVFTSDYELYSLHEQIKFAPANTLWIKYPKLYKKDKLISMISSSHSVTLGHQLRLDLINKYKNQIDIYGRQINPIPMKEFGLKKYMFSFAIENSSYKTYFTEKILDCFATGTIPIYWGAPDIGEHFNLDGIIIFDENFDINMLSEDFYYSKMNAIKDNYDRAIHYQVLENYIYDRYLNEKKN